MSDSTVNNLPTGEGLTFEKVWAMFQETDRKMQETAELIKETDRQMKENAKQLAEGAKENERRMQETDRIVQETNKAIGDLSNRFGEVAEHLVAPNIAEKFAAFNFDFTRISRNHEIKAKDKKAVLAEVDILMENGDVVMVVEVKLKPKQKDVDDHKDRIEVLRRIADRNSDKRKFQGAIAGVVVDSSVRDYAYKSGFYIIEPSGNTVQINVPEGFVAREW